MILDRLELRNFKRFRDVEIHFRDGITGILGNNGTGKSSLVEAIFFALYGVRATGISGDYILSSFAGPKEKCDVRLDFRIGGDRYAIHRTFRKKPGKPADHTVSFYHNGRERAHDVSQVEEEVKRTIGMGPVDFKNTIYAAQKDLLTLLENTPGKRKEWFQKALGIDFLKSESDEILKEQIEEKNAGLLRKEGELSVMAGRQSEEERARLETAILSSRAALDEHTKKRDLLVAKKKRLDTDVKRLTEKKLTYNRLTGEQQSLRTEREKEAAHIRKLEGLLNLIAEEETEYHRIEKMAGSYAAVRANLDALQKKKAEHARLTGELGFAKREISDLGARIERQREQIKALDADEQKKDGLVTKVRAGLGSGEIAPDQLEQAVSFRLADINRQSGTLATRLARYEEEREKIAADQKTIRAPGLMGSARSAGRSLAPILGTSTRSSTQDCRILQTRPLPISDGRRNSAERRTRSMRSDHCLIPSVPLTQNSGSVP